MQAATAKKRHSRVEIATKLAQANDLVTRGKPQSEIARTLGVSINDLEPVAQGAAWASARIGSEPRGERARPRAPRDDRIAELQLENSRLRRLTDLLLDQIKLEEAAKLSA